MTEKLDLYTVGHKRKNKVAFLEIKTEVNPLEWYMQNNNQNPYIKLYIPSIIPLSFTLGENRNYEI